MAEQPFGQNGLLAGTETCDVCIAPEPQSGVLSRHDKRIISPGVDREYGSGQRVLRLCTFRIEWSGVAPGASPDISHWIDLGAGMGFLVGHHRPVRGAAAVDGVLPADLPEHLVTAEKRQVDTRVTRGFHMLPLLQSPVFIMPDRQEQPMVKNLFTAPGGIHSGEITDIVAIGFQPTNKRILAGKDRVDRPVVTGLQRPVVTHLVGPRRATVRPGVVGIEPAIGTVTTVAVVSLPSRVGGLKKNLRSAEVISDHKIDMAGARFNQGIGQAPVAQYTVGMS